VDFDDDGNDDFLSGSYVGNFFLFKGLGNNDFSAGENLKHKNGQEIVIGMSDTAEAVDFDSDGDLDLVIGSKQDGAFLIVNEGTRKAPVFSDEKTKLMSADGKHIQGANAHFVDWDGDGIKDLVLGHERGGIFFHKNEGDNKAPKFAAAKTLMPVLPRAARGAEPTGPSSRTKIFMTDYNRDGKQDLLSGDVAGYVWVLLRK
jgi:hypothetical protein